MKIRIALIHNHFLVKNGLEMLINGNDKFQLVASSLSWGDLPNKTPQVVDVVVFNFKDEEAGVVRMGELKSLYPGARFMSVSYLPSRKEVSEALNAGVVSFLLTECDAEEIYDSIISTSRGEQFFCGKILSQVVQSADEALPASEYMCEGIRISARESEIIRLVAEGLTNKEIADKLFLSAHTVTTHRKNIMAKLHVNNTAGLMMFAIRNNIITPDSILHSN